MIRKTLLFVFFTATSLFAAAPQTMRLDYFHTGNDKQEMYSFDQVVLERVADELGP